MSGKRSVSVLLCRVGTLALFELFTAELCVPHVPPQHCLQSDSCSALTPAGVGIAPAHGASPFVLGAVNPDVIALGGRETIQLTFYDFASRPLPPFALPSVPPVLDVSGLTGTQATLQGTAVGTASLRVLDPRNNQLYQRHPVQVVPVQTVRVLPFDLIEAGVTSSTDGPLTILAGSAVSFHLDVLMAPYVVLAVPYVSSSGAPESIFDESLTATATNATDLTVTQPDWQTMVVTGRPGGSATIVLSNAGGSLRSIAMTAVGAATGLVLWAYATPYIVVPPYTPLTPATGATLTLPVLRGYTYLCAGLVAGLQRVVGASFAFSYDPDPDPNAPTMREASNCIVMFQYPAGTRMVTVSAAGLTQTFAVTFR